MPESVKAGLVPATQVSLEAVLQRAPNGVQYAMYGDTAIAANDLARMVQAVPAGISSALAGKAYYFVPLAMNDARFEAKLAGRTDSEATMIAPVYTPELSDRAICHRNVALGTTDGVFISTRLLSDRFALAFEFFINVGHALVDAAGVPAAFADLVWSQALADVRGETSQDAWESRSLALTPTDAPATVDGKPRIDEKARNEYVEAAFSDAVAIYQLSLAVDFDYSELREREYPLLAPQPLADRLRLTAKLFPPNPTYEFAIRYRRRA
jgi:hypothetical protein